MGVKKKISRNDDQLDMLSIDEHVLDDEWVNQPKLYGQYALEAAGARKEFDESKAQLDAVSAKLSMQIRENPKQYGLEKVTEKSIQDCLLTTKEHAEAVDGLIQSRYRMEMVNALVGALDQRKRALEKLVDLRLADYFSEPKASTSSRPMVDDMKQKRAARRGQKSHSKGKFRNG